MSDVKKQIAENKTAKTPKNPKGAGRPPGAPNKASISARQAIACFVDGNTHRLQEWLDKIAEGTPKLDSKGRKMYDADGEILWENKPNPAQAFTLFQQVIEYHVPKLARSEITGADGGPVTMAAIDLKGLSDAELNQMHQLLSKASK